MQCQGINTLNSVAVEASTQYKYLVNMLMQADTEVYLHSSHVRNVTAVFAARLNQLGILDNYTAGMLISSAILHDLGKLLIPGYILHSEHRLSDLDFKLIQAHSEAGELILSSSLVDELDEGFLSTARKVARSHHEKMNGSGYPDNLSGKEIPIEARVIAIADVYEALRSIRSYKLAYTHSEAIEIMKEEAGSHLDSDLFNIFTEIDGYSYNF